MIVGLAFFLYPYLQGCSTKTSVSIDQQISQKMEELRKFVTIVTNHIQLERAFSQEKPFLLKPYEIRPSTTITSTEGHILYLVFVDKTTHQLYDDNTLRYRVLRELASAQASTSGDIEEFFYPLLKLIRCKTTKG